MILCLNIIGYQSVGGGIAVLLQNDKQYFILLVLHPQIYNYSIHFPLYGSNSKTDDMLYS